MRRDALALGVLMVVAPAVPGTGTGTSTGMGTGMGTGFDLHAAIAAAAPGATIVVPPGVYRGPVVIGQPLTLAAAPGAVIDGGGDGDVVRLESADVTLRGFLIRNTGISLDRENAGIVAAAPRAVIEGNVIEGALFGIYLKGAPDSVIRGNVIGGKDLPVQRRGDGLRLWQSDRTLIEDNSIHDSRDAVLWYSQGLVLRRNHVVRGRYGLHFMYSHGNSIEDNVLEDNSVGAFLMYSQNLTMRRNVLAYNRGPSGYGLGLKDMDGALIEDNLVLGNRVGIHIDNSPQSLRVRQTLRGNVVAYNDIGVAFMPSVKRNDFAGNAFLDNLEQVAVLGSGDFSGNRFTVEGRGNFWSDYRGYDADGDGVGDLPYRSQGLFENLMDRQPNLRLFLYSPAQQAIDLAARAFPLVAPRPKLTDEAPLMEPVPLAIAPRPGGSRSAVLGLGAVMVAGAALVLIAGQRPLRGGVRAGAAEVLS